MVVLTLGVSAGAVAAEGGKLDLNLHVYAFSYHSDRHGAREKGLDNQFNPGLGLNYTVSESERGVHFVEAGLYRDSGSRLAKIAGMGYQFKLGKRWRLGGALLGVQSDTYNGGTPFIAPLPIATYDLGRVKLNVAFAPHYGAANPFAAFGFYVSVPLAR
jgi:hypothetical protein